MKEQRISVDNHTEKGTKVEPLISIIIPCYNGEKFIGRTIESVLNQTYPNYELIVIDNASIDNSYQVVAEYGKKDSRIKQYKIDVNIGGANAWKLGIEKAEGEFIAFLDADDLWLPEKLEKQVKFMIVNNYDFTFTKYHWISEDDTSLNNIISIKKSLNFKQFISNTCIGCSTVMIRTTRLKGFSIPVHQRVDWDFATWGLLLKDGCIAYGLDEDLMCYRIVSNSTSRNKIKYAKAVWNIYSDIFHINFLSKFIPFSMYAINAIKRNKKSILKIK